MKRKGIILLIGIVLVTIILHMTGLDLKQAFKETSPPSSASFRYFKSVQQNPDLYANALLEPFNPTDTERKFLFEILRNKIENGKSLEISKEEANILKTQLGTERYDEFTMTQRPGYLEIYLVIKYVDLPEFLIKQLLVFRMQSYIIHQNAPLGSVKDIEEGIERQIELLIGPKGMAEMKPFLPEVFYFHPGDAN